MRVLLLSRYDRMGASSRLRSLQYIPYLQEVGIDVTIAPLFNDAYVKALYGRKTSKRSLFKAYFTRIYFLLSVTKFNLIWIEYEILPWLPSWIELLFLNKKIPILVDYDDAIFHRYNQHRSFFVRFLLGKKIDILMHRANIVIVGNEYLAEYTKKAKAIRVECLPTVVDANRYVVLEKNTEDRLTIGWIGQPSTADYLVQLAPVLMKIIAKYSVRVIAIGPNIKQLESFPFEVKPWTEDSEVIDINQFDIGIMPLSDNLWEKGKCGYKIIQYMACGIPVVATPVGVNKSIVRQGVNGFLAQTETEWLDALSLLCEDGVLRKKMGDEGRKIMQTDFSLQVTAPRLAELLRSVVIS